MKTNLLCRGESGEKIVLRRRFSVFIILCMLGVAFPATANDQQSHERITLEMKGATVEQAIIRLANTTGYDFVYRVEDLPSTPRRDYDFRSLTIVQTMDRVLADTDLAWTQQDGIITISRTMRQQSVQQPPQSRKRLTGTVFDAKTRQPIIGAAVVVEGTTSGTATDAQGEYAIDIPTSAKSIQVRSLGYKSQTIVIGERSVVNVQMEQEDVEIETVVVDGITSRRAESYTGSAVTMKREDLLRVGNGNVFQSLKNLDPSLYIMDNFDMGSDPNSLPSMTMRGSTSFVESMGTDNTLKSNYQNVPNMPLFILDGFETSAEKIFDMDMNRIETITLLKDAAAKAIYGSKAANGVIVIETLKLKSNKPVISYVGSFDIQMPDLSSYDMCNAMEKLDIEFTELYFEGSDYDLSIDKIKEFYDRRRDVLSGLEVDWMAKPVRAGFGQKHSVIAEVGHNDLRVMLGGSYNNVVGVMKGSDRTTVSGNVNVNYRLGNFRIANNMEYTYNDSYDSPFGEYSAYTRMNPYESLYDEYGQIRPFIGNKSNPYYDGLLKTKKQKGYRQFTNNMNLEWTVVPGLTLRGRLGIDSHVMNATEFYPASHSTQVDHPSTREEDRRPADERGMIRVNNGEKLSFTGNFTVAFNKVFAEKHFLSATAYSEISNINSQEVTHTAVGLPSDNMDDILYALRYREESRPTGMSSIRREVAFLGNFQYSWDDRFISDASIRTNASSIFGSNKRWATFWSVGFGWNLHNEAFISNERIKQLRVRASIGTTGSQNFQNNKSLSIYEYVLGDRYNGKVGTWVRNMENPDLQWERSLDYNLGVDIDIYGVYLTVEAYKKETQNMVTNLAIAPSTGFSSVSENIGTVENTGFEIRLNYRAISRRDTYLNFYGSLTHNRNRIKEISNAMKTYNETIKEQYSKAISMAYDPTTYLPYVDYVPTMMPALVYENGNDINAIWAVKSAGIDPATGIEAYYGQDGLLTYIYKGSDLQAVGTSDPKFRGTFGINGEWKGIGISVTCRFLGGGQYYNSTLMNKVENISITDNFDRRALTERWSKVDQKAYFKRLTERNIAEIGIPYDIRSGIYTYSMSPLPQSAPTRATSRFVQDRNELDISQISVYYDFNPTLLKKIGMSRLKVSAYMNDVAKFSTIGIERGTTYPFARTISFSVTGSF